MSDELLADAAVLLRSWMGYGVCQDNREGTEALLEQIDEHRSKRRANYLLVSQNRLLNDWGKVLIIMFHGEVAYHVGSSLERADYRDVDVRMMLDDEVYDALEKLVSIDRLNLVVSMWGQRVTRLPIDFQVQKVSEGNALPAPRRRNALGIGDR